MLEVLGLIFSGIGIGVVVSFIIVTIMDTIDAKNEKDIYEKLDEWSKHRKEIQIPVNTIKPDRYIIRKGYSFDLINAVPQDYLRNKIKDDFSEEFKKIIEPYFMVDTDFDYARQEVRLVLWITKDGEFDGTVDDIWKEI